MSEMTQWVHNDPHYMALFVFIMPTLFIVSMTDILKCSSIINCRFQLLKKKRRKEVNLSCFHHHLGHKVSALRHWQEYLLVL